MGILTIVLGFIISLWMGWSLAYDEYKPRLEEYDRLITECELDLPRNQYCKLVAEIISAEDTSTTRGEDSS